MHETATERWFEVAGAGIDGSLSVTAAPCTRSRRKLGRPPSAGQSSSGRKMCGAMQALQIGMADSRSPRGIGTRRSG